MVNRPKHIEFDIFLLPSREGNGQYPNESLWNSTVRPEITHVARVTMLPQASDISLEALVKRGVLEVTKNFVTSEIPTNSGVQQTMLYDLKVFNYLVMRLDTDRASERQEVT